MRMKTALLAGVVAAACAAGPAHAAYILTTTGTVDSGTDTLGLFGAPGGSLAGDAYSLSVAYGINYPTSTTPTLQQVSGAVAGPVSVTVNGITAVIPVSSSLGALLQAFNNVFSSELFGLQSGTDDATGQFVSTSQEVFSSTPDVTGPLLTASRYDTQAGDFASVSFCTSIGFDSTSFSAAASTVSLAVVPEPASVAPMAAGLIGLLCLMAARRGRPAR